MIAPQRLSTGDKLRREAEALYRLAEIADAEPRGINAVQKLHDAIETAAGDVRAIVRGRR